MEKVESGVVPYWADGCTTLLPESPIDELKPHMVSQTVRGITMKSLYEKYNLHNVDFIQIDTEGSDYDIFMQLIELGLSAELMKIEVAHITQAKAVWMKWYLEQYNYKVFIDVGDLIAYRF